MTVELFFTLHPVCATAIACTFIAAYAYMFSDRRKS